MKKFTKQITSLLAVVTAGSMSGAPSNAVSNVPAAETTVPDYTTTTESPFMGFMEVEMPDYTVTTEPPLLGDVAPDYTDYTKETEAIGTTVTTLEDDIPIGGITVPTTNEIVSKNFSVTDASGDTVRRIVCFIGEKLDLSNLYAYAGFSYENGLTEDVLYHTPLDDKRLTVDTSKFDSSTAGIYPIYVSMEYNRAIYTTSFEVEVLEDVPTAGDAIPTIDDIVSQYFSVTDASGDTVRRIVCFIGEKLDLSNLYAYAGFSYENGLTADVLYHTPLDDERLTVDTSKFDSSTPGIYPIYVSMEYNGATYTTSFEVEVLEDVPTAGIAPAYEPGDIDRNGRIDMVDLTDLSLYLLGDKELDSWQLLAADINRDGETNLADLPDFKRALTDEEYKQRLLNGQE